MHRPEHEADPDDTDGEQDGDDDGLAGVLVGEDPLVVVQAGEAALVGVVGVPVHEGDDERPEERQLGQDDDEDQRWQQRGAPGPVTSPRELGRPLR